MESRKSGLTQMRTPAPAPVHSGRLLADQRLCRRSPVREAVMSAIGQAQLPPLSNFNSRAGWLQVENLLGGTPNSRDSILEAVPP